LLRQYVYRQPPQYRPQYYRARAYEPYTLRWLYNRATQQYVVASITGTPGSGSLFYTTGAGSGAILVTDQVTSLGYPIVLRSDGTFSITAGGDTSPQTFSFNIYRNSAFDGSAIAYVNYLAPVATSAPVVIAVERNQTITPQDLSGYIIDPQGNSLTFSMISDPPGSVDVAGAGALSGASPDANSITAETLRGLSVTGDYADLIFTLIVGNVTEPDVSYPASASVTQASATGLLAASYLNTTLGIAVNSATVPPGAVVSQTPAALNEVAPFSTVTISLSLGSIGAVAITSELPSPVYGINTGTQSIDLAAYSSGGSTYSVSPPSLDVAGSLLQLPTNVAGLFGPFTVTASNATPASASFAPFTYTVLPAPIPIPDTRPPTSLRVFLLH